jgi:hypothetical protein
MTRQVYACLQIAVALVAPAVYATCLTTFSFAEASFKGVLYWLAIPAVAFLALAALSLLRRGEDYLLSDAGMWGAALGGYLGMILPAVALLLTSGPFYRGGGVNIGVAFLVVGVPLYLPFAVAIGFAFGHRKRSVQP